MSDRTTETTDSEETSYDDWTVTELKDEAKARGLSNYSSLDKASLVELLETNDEEDDEEDEEDDEEDDEDEEDLEDVEYEHEFGTCVPLAPCPHVKGQSTEESDEESDEDTEEDE